MKSMRRGLIDHILLTLPLTAVPQRRRRQEREQPQRSAVKVYKIKSHLDRLIERELAKGNLFHTSETVSQSSQ
jgi:hypothetical protein